MQSHFQGKVPILCNVSIAIVSISHKDIAGVFAVHHFVSSLLASFQAPFEQIREQG